MSYADILRQYWQDAIAPRAKNAPTVISTFAGGGSSTGYHMAGYNELLAVEWDAHACGTLRLNYPHLPVYHGDIANLSSVEAMALADIGPGELDLLDGSPPCQGFSTAGARMLNDSRNQLFREYTRLLREINPRTFVMENVSGMVKGKMKLIFAQILMELKACGYQVSARLMDSQYFGVPQIRQRLIFIGVRNDLGIQPSHPRPQIQPVAANEAIPGFTGQMVTAGNERHTLAGRLKTWSPSKPSPTIMATRAGISYFQDGLPKIFTTDELKRLGAFPDEYILTGSKAEQWRRIGNSVPPLMARAIGLHIRETILKK